MASLLIESLSLNKTSFKIAVRAIELVLLSAGLVSTFLMFKGAVSPYSYDIDHMLSNLSKPFSYLRNCLSSTFYICIIMNLIVILIAVSSLFHHPKRDQNSGDFEDGFDGDDYDMLAASSSSSPPPIPSPMYNNRHQTHIQEPNPKDMSVAAAAAAAAPVAVTEKGGEKIKITQASMKIQQEFEVKNDVGNADASFQDVFSAFSRLTEAKEIKKAPTSHGTTRDKNDDEEIDDTKGIAKTSTTKNGQQIIKGFQNQFEHTRKQHEIEDRDDDDDDDTMEATWRAIKEGGTKPEKKQLKKSETWPQPNNINDLEEEILPSSTAALKEMRKSMTFNDTVSIGCRGGLRRDPSVNLEEFNQRIEAFIKNFNNEMRLQRQESEQRYLDMISRGL